VVSDWIKKLEESNSRLHKEAIIEQAYAQSTLGDREAIRFLMAAELALSPYITYGVKQIPVSDEAFSGESDWESFAKLLNALATRELSGHAARDAITKQMETFAADDWNFLARRVLIKDLRCGTSEKTFNKILKGTNYEIDVFACQLAKDSEDHPHLMKGKKQLEVKLDGVRVLAIVQNRGATIELFSRNGQLLENFPRIIEEIRSVIVPRIGAECSPAFSAEYVLDGEMMSSSFQSLMKEAKTKNRKAKTNDCIFNVFDLIPFAPFSNGSWSRPQSERSATLAKIIPPGLSPIISTVPYITVDLDTADGVEEMRQYMANAIERKFEGIMLKDCDAPYTCDRSSAWLKRKPTISVDLAVTEIIEGTGKYEGMLGALAMIGSDQDRVIATNCGSGFSDDDRRYIFDHRAEFLGRVAEVIADGITQNQNGTFSLRFPRFGKWRGFVKGEKI
jgi:DNA ligase 1